MTQTLDRSDAGIKADVIDELRWVAGVDRTRIGVAVYEGAVILAGEVGTLPEQLLACAAAQRMIPVAAVADEISVRAEPETSDEDVAREVGKVLRSSINVPDTVRATVSNRKMTLSGSVQWQHERLAAGRAVGYVKSVRAVINQLALNPTSVASGLEADIRAALLRNAQLEGKQIHVRTDLEGVVAITGRVRSWAAIHQIERICWAGPGVTAVTHHLQIDN